MKVTKSEKKELHLALDMMERVLSHEFLAQGHMPELNCLRALGRKRHKKYGRHKCCEN